jgi:peptide-methionine (S)-S-oxide reductase
MRNTIMNSRAQFSILKRLKGILPILVVGGSLGLLGASLLGNASSAEPRLVPPALHDIDETTDTQTAIFAGGCFWGVQGVFQHVNGVLNATSGYAGGSASTATYDMVETGSTGHAEAVEVKFDPRMISYGKLLQIYFSVAHDPTQLDRQGPDTGTQYRSAIFATSDEQAKVATDYIAQLETADVFKARIATTIESGKPFYKAEAYHQDFMVHNPTNPYIAFNEQSKIDDLDRLFPQSYREEPVLTSDSQG